MKIKPSAGEIEGGKERNPPTPLGVKGGFPSHPVYTSQENYVEKVKELCRGLDVRQRKEVRDYISYLDREHNQASLLSVRTSQSLTRDEEMWADSLEQSLAFELGTPHRTAQVRLYRAPATLSSLKDSYAIVHAFVQGTGMVKSMSYHRKALYEMLAGLVVTYSKQLAAKIGAPLSFRFVLQNVDKLPALFDRAYPGYAQAGLACIVVQQLLKPQPKE